ncbi:MAG: hypothetical protein CBB71_13205 [Rhodopirellula sp. TMED11]|nr:MAG: hypothetical protein CBB71_13205 [Rhodopirellula sp. TMED11]
MLCVFASTGRMRVVASLGSELNLLATKGLMVKVKVNTWRSIAGLRKALAVMALTGAPVLLGEMLSAAEPGESAAKGSVDFNRDIRPILSDKCFLCHGPAESTREAELRLDKREDAVDAGAFEPGDAEASELIVRVLTDDPDSIMPPPGSNKQLTDREKQLLQDWVNQGAAYADHWSFVPAKMAAGKVTGNPVDHFVRKRLAATGLKPSPAADLRTLIRRVSLDLTGLPPTTDQVEAFLAAAKQHGREVAYETLVDELLSSPAYGERMAVAWMDAARYGDTSVMHADGPRDMWPWRDWVINAYNKNMPFDQFTIEQIAGDLIPEATMEQKVASGFNRNHATSDEGGAFAEELRVEYVVDRVQTTSTVWLGLTMECGQCHDHKYDPISQNEYYQFFAYFNNTADPGMQTRNGNQSPVVEVFDQERQEKLAGLNQQVEDRQKGLDQYPATIGDQFAQWLEKHGKQEEAPSEEAPSEEALSDEAPSDEPSEPVADPTAGLACWLPMRDLKGNRRVDYVTGQVLQTVSGKPQVAKRGESEDQALKLDGRTRLEWSQQSPQLSHDKPWTMSAWIKWDGKSSGAVFSKMDVGNGYRGYDLWIQGSGIGTHFINQWPSNAIKVVSKGGLVKDKWQHVVVTYDGSMKAAGVAIYIDGDSAEGAVEADTLTGTTHTDTAFRLAARSTGGNWAGEVDDIRLYERALSADEVGLAQQPIKDFLLASAADQRTELQTSILRSEYLQHHDGEYQKLVDQFAGLVKQRDGLIQKKTTSMIMQDNPANRMRMTYILDRGQYDSPKKEKAIEPGVPAALPALPEGAPANRLGLAQWLTMPEHPLTSRVAVNRHWMMLFGEGLVRTVSDFGAQGTPPSHPELLDYLAVDFVDSGWDVKRMIRQMVLSQTYQQSSRVLPAHLEDDPQNIWLARSPRFRLQGEFIRDQALSISGLLTDSVGGPGVKPYQPPNIWNEVSLNGGLRYRMDDGDKLYRKSMYTYWKRSAPMPNMMIFDAPSREKCVVQRARTNTPLQALVTLNDPQFVEAARGLAERLIAHSDADEKRFDYAYQLATSRPATEKELAVLAQLLEQQRQRFAKSKDLAEEFLKVGSSQRDNTIDPVEHAAWTVIAQIILNLDETLCRG